MSLLVLAAAWVLLSLLAGQIAQNKGRDNASYFFLALFLSPLVGILAAVVATPKKDVVERTRLASGSEKKCPFCAELVKTEAVVCRFCGREFAPGTTPATPATPPRNVYDDWARPGTPHFQSKAEYESWRASKAKKT